MVFFTCNGCGTAVKKNQVDKHYRQCGNCEVLSCMDCGKDFWGNDYQSHIKCITEDEKYGGKDYKPKQNFNKGEAKQEQWIEHVKHTIATTQVPKEMQHILERLITFPNIPRKKAKFMNFLKNCVQITNPALADETWEIFDKAHKKQDSPTLNNGVQKQPQSKKQADELDVSHCEQARLQDKPHDDNTSQNSQKKGKKRKKSQEKQDASNQDGTTLPVLSENHVNSEIKASNGDDEEGRPKKKKKKKKEAKEEEAEVPADVCTEEQQSENVKPTKFKWRKAIKACLQQEPKYELKIKKLRKKVFSEYHAWARDGQGYSVDELRELFDKKLKDPSFQVYEKKVKLLK